MPDAMKNIDLSTHVVDNSLTNINFAAFCVQMIGQPYWYGCCGYKASESLRSRKAKQYPSHYKENRTTRYKQDIANKCVVADCVGACKGTAWAGPKNLLDAIGTDKSISSKYGANGCPDKSANGMFTYAKSKGMAWGTIDTIPEVVGVAVRFDGHVGYYIGNGEVVEWRGFSYGCVRTKLTGRKWLHWYQLPFIDYGDAFANVPTSPGSSTAVVATLGSRLLKKGMVGQDVKALQELLIQLEYDLSKYGADGDFGSETEAAVKSFQKKAGVKVDGKYGDETHKALMDAVADDDEGKGNVDEDDQPATETPDAPAEPDTSTESTPETTPVKTVLISAGNGGKVNIRVGNGTNYGRITSVASGTVLPYIATAPDGWHAVALSDRVGWVSGKYSQVV